MASAVVRAVVSSTSLQTTRPPRRASSMAKAAPMPLPAPVITAAASRLRFSDDPKMPIASPCLLIDGVCRRAILRRTVRCAASPRRPPGTAGARPGRRAPGPARPAVRTRRPQRRCRRPTVWRRPTSISAPPAWTSVGGIGRPRATSSVSRGCARSVFAQYNLTSRLASRTRIAGSRRSASRARDSSKERSMSGDIRTIAAGWATSE